MMPRSELLMTGDGPPDWATMTFLDFAITVTPDVKDQCKPG